MYHAADEEPIGPRAVPELTEELDAPPPLFTHTIIIIIISLNATRALSLSFFEKSIHKIKNFAPAVFIQKQCPTLYTPLICSFRTQRIKIADKKPSFLRDVVNYKDDLPGGWEWGGKKLMNII